MESVASLQQLNLDMTALIEEEARVKSLQVKLEKSTKTIDSDLEREKSISLDADLNEKRISKEKEELLKTENQLANLETNSSKELKVSKSKLEDLQVQLDKMLDKIETMYHFDQLPLANTQRLIGNFDFQTLYSHSNS